eukprot:6490413-Amphidinium_carterae.1
MGRMHVMQGVMHHHRNAVRPMSKPVIDRRRTPKSRILHRDLPPRKTSSLRLRGRGQGSTKLGGNFSRVLKRQATVHNFKRPQREARKLVHKQTTPATRITSRRKMTLDFSSIRKGLFKNMHRPSITANLFLRLLAMSSVVPAAKRATRTSALSTLLFGSSKPLVQELKPVVVELLRILRDTLRGLPMPPIMSFHIG